MGFYTNVHREIWNDEAFWSFDDMSQLAFFHLLTTPLGTQFGVFKAGIAALAEDKRWKVEQYRKAINPAIEVGFAKFDEKHRLWLIPAYVKRNPPGSINVIKAWGRAWNELPDCDLKTESYSILLGYMDAISEAFEDAFLLAFAKPKPMANAKASAMPAVSVPESEQEKIDPVDIDVQYLVDLMASEMRAEKPNSVVRVTKGWAVEMRRLLKRDERTREQAEAVIKWACHHRGSNGFSWAAVVRSPGKLREKFDTLEMQMNRDKGQRSLPNAGELSADDQAWLKTLEAYDDQ